MRVARSGLRKGICALTLVSVGIGTAVVLKTPTSAARVDVYAFQAHNQPNGITTGVSLPGTYTFGPVCVGVPLASPVGTTVPGYVDVPTDESGPCPSVTGSGTLTVVNCDKGLITADWAFTEPNGDTAAFNGTGVIVGGVAVIAAPPAAGFGYVDPAPTSTPGGAVAVALFTTDSPLTSECGQLNSTIMDEVLAGVAAAY